MSRKVNYEDKAKHYGNNLFIEPDKTALEKVIEKIVSTAGENIELVDIIDDLKDYITESPGREIVGLEVKLKDGGREDALGYAIQLKNKFERRVAKAQMSLVEQKVYVQVLAHILTAFNQIVRPLILEGRSKQEVDSTVWECIIEPVHKAITEFDDCLTKESILGMLFFLTGKCHLIWSKAC